MIDQATELKLYASANIIGADTGAVGGAISATQIIGASSGEFLPRLRADNTGTIDVNVQTQYQKAFWKNLNGTSSLLDARIYLKNGLKRPAAPATIWIETASSSDANKQLRFKAVSGSSIVSDPINTPSSPGTASGANGSINWIERVQLVNMSGVQVNAAADIFIKIGSSYGSAEYVGKIPAGYAWATGEVKLAGVATVDDNGTSTSRRNAPSGLTFIDAFSYETGIIIRLDENNDSLGPGEAQGFWAKQTLQPGMPPSDQVQYVWRLEGESSA